MRFQRVALESMALNLPREVWSSLAIEARLQPLYNQFKLSAGRLELMTGIRERRVWTKDFMPSVEAAGAARMALERSSLPADSIGLLIHAGVCRDRLEPATAAYVHQILGLPKQVQFMDISNACLGFLNAMLYAASLIECGAITSALIVTAETSRNLIDNTVSSLLTNTPDRKRLKQSFANLTIGSGAVAAVLCSATLAPGKPRLHHAVAGADSSHNQLCEGEDGLGGHEMLTDSEALLHAGIGLASSTWHLFQKETRWADEQIDHYLCHQVGKMHQRALYEALSIDLSKDFSTYPELGNMGSAALPGTLAAAWESKRFSPGQKIALLGIGSGISSVMMGLEWGASTEA